MPPEQQRAMVDLTLSEDFSTVSLVSADAATWDRVRSAFPALASLSDEELAIALDSYVNTPPTVWDILLKTPVGPVVFLNIVLAITGWSWCDVPFADKSSTACVQLAARVAGQ